MANTSSSLGAKLCARCQVLEFNDEKGHRAESKDGKPYLEFDLRDESRRFDLDYSLIDYFPDLPNLKQSEDQGCEFCLLLRQEIIQARFDSQGARGAVTIHLVYHWKNFWFGEHGLSALVAEMKWNDQPPGKRANCIIFTVESNDEPVSSWLRLPSLRNNITLCDKNIKFMKTALEKCTSQCHPPNPRGHLPARLLDLGHDSKSLNARLIESAIEFSQYGSTFSGIKYAALSYCWGSPSEARSQLRTFTSTLGSMQKTISESSMPGTLRDAIKVCKSLSIQYLWVDSLCIIQDSQDDWETQSTLMALIYKDAFVTISASSSVSCQESFLVRNRRLVELEFRSTVASEVTGRFSLVASGICGDWFLLGWPELDIRNSRLATRGWTLQEEQCSTRMLLFGKSMIHFQCSGTVSENGMEGHDLSNNFLNSLSELELEITPENLDSFYRDWTGILSDYCQRDLTDPEDSLPGLAGMASLAAETTGDQYLAGIWKDDLAAALIWYPFSHQMQDYRIELWELVEKLSNPAPYIAPTWSPLRLRGLGIERGLTIHTPRYSWTAESVLIEAQINVNGLNPFGKIQHGSMRLKGKLNKLKSDINTVPNWYAKPKLWYSRHEDRGGCLVYYNLDWQPTDAKVLSTELFMLMTASTTGTESVQDFIQEMNSRRDRDVESSSACDSHESSDESNADNGADTENLDLGSGELIVDRDADSHIKEGNEHEASNSDNPVNLIGDDRDAWGLLLHPAREMGKYLRVGVWVSTFADSGGIRYFKELDSQEVEII